MRDYPLSGSIRPHPNQPQHTAPLKQHDVNHHWTVDSICGWSSALSGNICGWRAQMEVHLKANSNIFWRGSYRFSHISNSCERSTNTFLFPRNLMSSALSTHHKQSRMNPSCLNLWAPVSDGSSGCKTWLHYLDRGEAPAFGWKERKHGRAPNKRIKRSFSHDREVEAGAKIEG